MSINDKAGKKTKKRSLEKQRRRKKSNKTCFKKNKSKWKQNKNDALSFLCLFLDKDEEDRMSQGCSFSSRLPPRRRR